MLLVSFALVVVAAVLLVIGVVQDGLWLVLASIGASVLALTLVGVDVVRHRGGDERARHQAP